MVAMHDEKQYHIALSKDMLAGARYALIAGDPGRIPKIAQKLENVKQLAYNREYNSYLGTLYGQAVVVMSHGIGGPSTAIAVEELHMLGIDTYIRIGTSGGIAVDVQAGDVVVVQGAIRAEGTSQEYLPLAFPAVADLDVTLALRDAANALGLRYHVGVAQCKDSFYGQHNPDRMPLSHVLLENWNAWKRGGALVSEMETAALFTICSTLRARAGAVMLCVWNQEREAAGLPQDSAHSTEQAINVAVMGLEKIIRADMK